MRNNRSKISMDKNFTGENHRSRRLIGQTMFFSLVKIYVSAFWLVDIFGYIVMLRARMFRSLIIRTGIKERNIRARNITI